MYTREFWDMVYRRHIYDAPWMSDSCVRAHITNIEKYISDVNGLDLLDYGCGSGELAFHFFKKGARVDLADISDELIAWLKKKYAKEDIGIYCVETPKELQRNQKQYDIIVATSFFHHIEPDLWKTFLQDFTQRWDMYLLLTLVAYDFLYDPLHAKDGVWAHSHLLQRVGPQGILCHRQ